MISEIAYFTANLAGTVAFYRQVLGKDPGENADGIASFQSGTVKLFLHETYQPTGDQLKPENHVAITVQNLDKACQKLNEAGIILEKGPKQYEWGKSAYLRDPDGNLVELLEAEVNWSNVHRYFSAACFNQAWDYIEKKERTPEEEETMISLVHTSIWHWRQRPDCTSENLAVGYWQASRVYALAGWVENARHYGQLCLQYAQGGAAWAVGFAYEALARAEHIAGNIEKRDEYLREARQQAALKTDEESRKILEADLDTILDFKLAG